jgi:hypothetical protein
MNEGESVYYKTQGFIECEIEIDHDDVVKAVEEYLWANTDFDFDECDIHNDRPFGFLLTAKCRKYVGDPDDPDADLDIEADVETDEVYPDDEQEVW